MEYGLSIFASTASLTSSGTATATPIPFDTQGYFPRHIRVSTTADCYVACGDIGVTAVAGDMLLQAGDAQLLHVSDCKAISILSVSGSATVTVAAMELGNWTSDQRTLDYNFTTLSAVPSPVTYSGGSSRTFFGSDGLLKVQGYNLLLQSNKFDTTWSVARLATPSQTGVSAPDGTASWVVTEDATAANTHALIQGYSFSTATSYTFSIYAKMGTQRWINLTLPGSVFTSGDVYFDLQNGVKGTENGGATGAITSVGNGWYRCSISKTSTGAATANLIVYSTDSGSSVTVATPSARTLYLYGAQLEAGSTATQYSPTTTAANSAPRLDYDPATLLPRGLLVEEQRVNLLLQSVLPAGTAGTVGSGAVAPTSWTFGFTGATVSFPPSRFGTNGVRFTTTGATRSYIAQTVSVSASTTYVLSALVDTVYSGSLSVQQAISYATMPAGATQTYTKNGITVSGSTTFTTGDVIAAVMVVSTTAGTAECRVGAGCVGDGTSGDYLFTAPQCEAGAFKTSYIPTTTAAATRSADSALMNNTNFSSWYNQTQGTFVTEFSLNPQPAGLFPIVSQVDDGTANNRLQNFVVTAASTFVAGVNANSGGANQVNNTAATTSGYSVAAKSAYRYALNDYAFVTNGGAVSTDTSALLPVAVDRIRLGANQVGLSVINGHIRRLQFYPVALPSATLQSLTA